MELQYIPDGSKTSFTHKMWDTYFDDFDSVKFEPFSIAPLKIADTDPASRVEVYGVDKELLKNLKFGRKN